MEQPVLFHPAEGSTMEEMLLLGLGSDLDGCMTLSKSFWLVLSSPPAFICLLHADGFSIPLY